MARQRILLLLAANMTFKIVAGHSSAVTTTTQSRHFYHFAPYAMQRCSGTAYTDNEQLGCNGWNGISEIDCKKKCHYSATVGKCPKRECYALAFYAQGGIDAGWCHLYDQSQCRGMENASFVVTFVKEHGFTGTLPPNSALNAGALALAIASAIVAITEVSRGSNTTAQPSAGLLARQASVTTTIPPTYSPLTTQLASPAVLTTLNPMTPTPMAGPGSSGSVSLPIQVCILLCSICIVAGVVQVFNKTRQRRFDRGWRDEEYERGYTSDHGMSDLGSDQLDPID